MATNLLHDVKFVKGAAQRTAQFFSAVDYDFWSVKYK